jgi:hydrogenase maturation protease
MRYVIGVGNAAMGDDGIGPRVAEELAERAAELGFQAILSGHDTAGLLSYFDESTETILFVDSVRMGIAAGEWRLFSPGDVLTRKKLDRLTTHEGDLLRLMELARAVGCPIPAIAILGIEPERLEPGLEISATLEARFDEYLDAAIGFMEKEQKRLRGD